MIEEARPRIGIVIPTLEEARALPRLLDDLRRLPFSAEILVVDGGSKDGTLEAARARSVRTLVTRAGRARQMNAGAAALDTPWLVFLHADSRLPAETRTALEGWLAVPPRCEAAHFGFRLDARGLWWTLIERGQRLRERLTGLAYGDQGLIVSRRRFEEIGGIPDIPVMEDVETVRRLRRTGGIDRIAAPIVTSARRYRAEGPFLGWARNAMLISLYAVGVSPARLSRWYRPRPEASGRFAPPL